MSQLCSRCHDSMQLSRIAQHGTALERAHFYWLDRKPLQGETEVAGPDATTQRCLSCHDGLISADAGGSSLRLGSGVMAEHPVGVSLTGSFSDAALRSPASLDPRIRLTNNQVECLSCHSPYSTEKSLLVMSNHRSALCLNCHIQ